MSSFSGNRAAYRCNNDDSMDGISLAHNQWLLRHLGWMPLSLFAQPPAPIWPTQYTADTGCNLKPLHQWGDAMPLNPRGNTLKIWGTFCEHAIFKKNPKAFPPSPKWKETWPLGCILGNNYISSLLSEKNFYALKYSSSIVSTYFTTSLPYLRFGLSMW